MNTKKESIDKMIRSSVVKCVISASYNS